MGKKGSEYRRWDYEEETEISGEEHLTLDENECLEGLDDSALSTSMSTTSFAHPTVTLTATAASRFHPHSKIRAKASLRYKLQVLGLSGGLLVLGFIAGFSVGVRNEGEGRERSGGEAETPIPSPLPYSPHDLSDFAFHKLVAQVTAENIRHSLKRMSHEVHAAGTSEGRSMAIAIRDLWRSYGMSVRVEQHKVLLTRSSAFNYLEALDSNGSVLFVTSQVGDDVNLPNARPIVAFSPPADLNGSLIYGSYGRSEDFQFLQTSQIQLNGSIALLRYGNLHPSRVAVTAASFGLAGLVFYPDPADFGPLMPGNAVMRSSLLTLGQIHEYQKHRSNMSNIPSIPCHTISFNDAEHLLRLMRSGPKSPGDWRGRLKSSYPVTGGRNSPISSVRLRIFNEAKSSSIYNVVAAIPGAFESDRYIIVGCSHDSWSYGAGDPGIGLAILTEIARSFSSAVGKGWKPRRSVLFVSWDANLHGSSGVSHWLQEHHFEIGTRAVAYIDLTRIISGNETLHVFSSPTLREVARKAIAKIRHFDASNPQRTSTNPTIQFSSFLTADEPSFAFLGNLGVPFIRFALTNSPKGYDYPLFHTSFDTFENFENLADSTFNESESLGRMISGLILLLADSSLLPMNVEDYVEEIQTAFGNFMAHYQEDLHKANLSIAYLQAAVMRLEVIGDNFRTEMHNRSVITNEHEHENPPPPLITNKPNRRALFHRIINDKMMNFERAFLSRRADVFKHQILGFNWCSKGSPMFKGGDCTQAPAFPKLREAIECGRRKSESEDEFGEESGESQSGKRCGGEWRSGVGGEITSLIRSLDAASAILQSPLLPEESDSSSA